MKRAYGVKHQHCEPELKKSSSLTFDSDCTSSLSLLTYLLFIIIIFNFVFFVAVKSEFLRKILATSSENKRIQTPYK